MTNRFNFKYIVLSCFLFFIANLVLLDVIFSIDNINFHLFNKQKRIIYNNNGHQHKIKFVWAVFHLISITTLSQWFNLFLAASQLVGHLQTKQPLFILVLVLILIRFLKFDFHVNLTKKINVDVTLQFLPLLTYYHRIFKLYSFHNMICHIANWKWDNKKIYSL